jgi:hypothetical protein
MSIDQEESQRSVFPDYSSEGAVGEEGRANPHPIFIASITTVL